MTDVVEEKGTLRVGAHVLVQLGSELVTDAEQAILECVKNAYDADAPGCRIDVDTHIQGERLESGTVAELRPFLEPFETVSAALIDEHGSPVDEDADPSERAIRRLEYEGRISIEDTGTGIPAEGISNSWLVVSGSGKRPEAGQRKAKTARGRTPLGDKGLGRLGTMKLGDILLVETSTSPNDRLRSAQFRWTDCTSATTVDQIPVSIRDSDNSEKFKGTRVCVLGLRDIVNWRAKDRGAKLARSLAKLISPFEATSTFPVAITIDGAEHTLGMVTEEVLGRAVAEFEFTWGPAKPGEPNTLAATARLRKRLLAGERSRSQQQRTKLVFGDDGGEGFANFLKTSRRLRGYSRCDTDLAGKWFVEVRREPAENVLAGSDQTVEDPGPFRGAFYFFNLEDREGEASGTGVNVKLVKDMSGIAILRDGFRVRSQGDWLELSSGMTSGSTYNLRVENTIGYFALTGAENYRLIEKSDREGFVEDATYRGFERIARACRDFANGALVNVRRSVDDYYKQKDDRRQPSEDKSAAGAISTLRNRFNVLEKARGDVRALASRLGSTLTILEADVVDPANHARLASEARKALHDLDEAAKRLEDGVGSDLLLYRVDRELDENRDRIAALVESAAVGLSARGLTHEIRTHLAEIRRNVTLIERSAGPGGFAPHLRGIRRSCSAISQAAAQVDPLMPRSRAVKETFGLKEFATTYFEGRADLLDSYGAAAVVVGADTLVRINRPRLLQVIDNLTKNSLFWMRRAGLGLQSATITVETTPEGFTFADTGPGVDPHVEETLFDLFITTKHQDEGGQGLGLFIANELLTLDGCAISLMPDRNAHGRRFRFAVDLRTVLAKD